MKNQAVLLLALCALFLNLGCPKPAPPSVKFSLGRPFPLHVGQTAESADVQGFTIKFDKIASDSRCPQGVQCITAGKADVVLTLNKVGGSQNVTLPFTIPNGTSNVTDFEGYIVRVMGVSPIKYKDKEIKPEDYDIVLSVMPSPPKAKLGEEFALQLGESIRIEADSKYSIRFDSVTEDSRCLEGVQCIWAGRVICAYTFSNGGADQPFILTSGSLNQGGKGEAEIGPYTVQVKGISPLKRNGVMIQQKDYQCLLLLRKNSQ